MKSEQSQITIPTVMPTRGHSAVQRLALSPAEVAEALGISRTKVYDLLHSDDFPAFKVDNRTLIPVKELQDWLTNQVGGGLN